MKTEGNIYLKKAKEGMIQKKRSDLLGLKQWETSIQTAEEAINRRTHQAAKGLKAKHDRNTEKGTEKREKEFRMKNKETDQEDRVNCSDPDIPMPFILLQVVNTESSHDLRACIYLKVHDARKHAE